VNLSFLTNSWDASRYPGITDADIDVIVWQAASEMFEETCEHLAGRISQHLSLSYNQVLGYLSEMQDNLIGWLGVPYGWQFLCDQIAAHAGVPRCSPLPVTVH